MLVTIECRCGYCSDIETLNQHPKTCPTCGGELRISGTMIPLYVGRELNPWLYTSDSVESYAGPLVAQVESATKGDE